MSKHRNSKQYIRVPIVAQGMTANELLIYSYINSYQQDNKQCYSSKTSIATYFNISRQTVIRTIKKLCDKGYIASTYDSTTDRNTYRIIKPLDKSTEYVSIDKSVLQSGLSGHALLIYAYIQAHKSDSISKISSMLKVSISTVSRIVSHLRELKLIVVNRVRTALGRFAESNFLEPSHKADCDSHTPECNSHVSECYTDTLNNTYSNKYRPPKTNSFTNYSMKSPTYDGLSESELEALLLCN